ncbi:MAG: DoxX family protein [Gemmatimonadetes bacterium]|nr:DoxX family protein [Gemmatimonadota bacterium]
MPSPLFSASPRQQHVGLAVLRIVLGIVMTAHGYQKLFVYGIAGVQGAFTKMGAPMPMVTGPLVAALEFFGGIALIIGFLTRLVGLGLAIDMLGAILIVHGSAGFFMPAGYEFVLMLGAASLALAIAGPGAFSIDEIIAKNARR